MTAKEFLKGKTLTAVEIVDDLVFNLVVGRVVHGLDIDTEVIKSGTRLTRTDDFTIKGDILTAENASLNLLTTRML